MATNINTKSIKVSPFIEGSQIDSTSNQTFIVVNPSTGKNLMEIPIGSEADVDAAVLSAREAYDNGRWADMPPSSRKMALHRFANLIEAEVGIFDALDAEEMGKPVSLFAANAKYSAEIMRFSAESIDKLMGDVFTTDSTTLVVARQVPRGVVAAIVPWNFPTCNAVIKLAPALAAGNSVVLKPSEYATRSSIRLAQLALEAGIPPGVFNVVPGTGAVVGKALGLHMDVDMLTFTGSTEVGKLLQQYAGLSNMKVLLTECGGKSPHIVFDDIDLDIAADGIAQWLLMNQGQMCTTGSRLLVQRSVETEVLTKVTKRLENIVAGDALSPETTYGPIVSDRQLQKILNYIEVAQKEGAELVAGGNRILQDSGGYYVEPAVFRNVQPNATIAQEEIFGPVLSTMAFDDLADAVKLANGTPFGLCAFAWTASLSRGMKIAKGVRSRILVNSQPLAGEGAGHAAYNEPQGQSGIGAEGGLAGIESYLWRQLVWFNHG